VAHNVSLLGATRRNQAPAERTSLTLIVHSGCTETAFRRHWTSDLDKWFDKGVDTPGIVLIKVKANRVTYWKGRDEGEVDL